MARFDAPDAALLVSADVGGPLTLQQAELMVDAVRHTCDRSGSTVARDRPMFAAFESHQPG